MQHNEFNFIQNILAKNAGKRDDVILGIGDDCALVQVPPGFQLAISTDTSIEGVHFTQPAASAYDIGYKTLAVSLSDLAAMGAVPAWAMATLTVPTFNEAWLKEFCAGFFHLLHHHELQLIGGDFTQGPLSITTQVFGFVPPTKALTRAGAQPGDLIYVTGTLGDAGLALQLLQHQVEIPAAYQAYVFLRLNRPIIRIQAGVALRDFAHAAIDISDGLAADLGHILTNSNVGATIYSEKLPLSDALKNNLPLIDAWQLALSAGDDYELCFTIPPQQQNKLEQNLQALNCPITCIGKIEAEKGLRILQANNEKFILNKMGYNHFG